MQATKRSFSSKPIMLIPSVASCNFANSYLPLTNAAIKVGESIKAGRLLRRNLKISHNAKRENIASKMIPAHQKKRPTLNVMNVVTQ